VIPFLQAWADSWRTGISIWTKYATGKESECSPQSTSGESAREPEHTSINAGTSRSLCARPGVRVQMFSERAEALKPVGLAE